MENDVYAFLGVEVSSEGGSITLTQKGLIDKLLKTCGMSNCNSKAMPASSTPLGTDAKGPKHDEPWDYAQAVGMAMYLCNNTRPDIQFATHQCARFSHTPKASHKIGMK